MTFDFGYVSLANLCFFFLLYAECSHFSSYRNSYTKQLYFYVDVTAHFQLNIIPTKSLRYLGNYNSHKDSPCLFRNKQN